MARLRYPDSRCLVGDRDLGDLVKWFIYSIELLLIMGVLFLSNMKRKWSERHYAAVEEAEKHFKSHTEDDEKEF